LTHFLEQGIFRMVYDVYLQVKRTGHTHAHVPALPGCNWLAGSPDAAWEQATAAIQDHLTWLRRYGQPAAPLDEPVLPQLAQQNKSIAREGHLIGFFECDRIPVTPGEIPDLLRLISCARQEVLKLTQALPGEVLSWRCAAKEWCIVEVLRHVAGAQRYYLTRIFDPASIPIQPASRSVWKRLERMQLLSFEKLLHLSEEQRTAVLVDSSGELWSARKVFRRYLEHEREHTHHIQKIAGQFQAVTYQT
jgi:predicted RNase H-like HicB family nuclease